MKKKLYKIAHRGARSLAPENTMTAFFKAWHAGAHGVETDISVTSDEALILHHDPTFLRTTDVGTIFPQQMLNGIHLFSLEEVTKLDAGSWFLERDPFGTIGDGTVSMDEARSFRGAQVPTFEELLLFVKKQSWFINIEIKPHVLQHQSCNVIEKTLNIIDQIGLDEKMFSISSFHHPFLREIQKLRPDVEVNALIGLDESKDHDWGTYEFAIYNGNVNLIDPEQIDTAKKHGCVVNLYTVNDLQQIHFYRDNGVEKIITDFPQLPF